MRSISERIFDGFLGGLVILMLMVLYAPVVIGAIFSVVPVERGAPVWQTPTLEWYVALWHNQSVLDAIKTTVMIGSVSVLIATIIAVVIALYVNWQGAVGRRVLELVVYLPFLVPPLITGLSMLVFFADIGLTRGTLTLALGHIAFVMAVIYRLVSTRLSTLSPSLVAASADLGASGWQTFRYVLWPHLSSAVLTGAILAMTLSFDETFISVFLSGDATTLPLRLWGMARLGFSPEINALVTIILAVSIVLAIIIGLRMKPQDVAAQDEY